MNEYKLTLFYFSDDPVVFTKTCPSDDKAIDWAGKITLHIGENLSYKLEKITKTDLTSLLNS